MYCPCPLPIFVLSPLYCDGFGIILLLFLIRSSDGGFDPSDTSFSAGVFFKSLCLNGTSILLSPCAPIVVFFFQPLLSPQGFDVLSDLSVHPRPLYIRGRPAASKAAIPPTSPRCTGLGNGKQRGHWRGQGLRGCLKGGTRGGASGLDEMDVSTTNTTRRTKAAMLLTSAAVRARQRAGHTPPQERA